MPLVYYYLGTIIGLTLLLIGLVGSLQGLVQAAFPEASDEYIYSGHPDRFDESGKPVGLSEKEKDEAEEESITNARRGGFAGALQGAVMTIVAAPVFFWHLRQARRREPDFLAAASPPASQGK